MATSVENGTTLAELQDECRRLRVVVERLQAELAENRRALATVQAERDAYLKSLYAWSRSQVSQEQLRQWATEQDVDGVTLDQLMAELDASSSS